MSRRQSASPSAATRARQPDGSQSAQLRPLTGPARIIFCRTAAPGAAVTITLSGVPATLTADITDQRPGTSRQCRGCRRYCHRGDTLMLASRHGADGAVGHAIGPLTLGAQPPASIHAADSRPRSGAVVAPSSRRVGPDGRASRARKSNSVDGQRQERPALTSMDAGRHRIPVAAGPIPFRRTLRSGGQYPLQRPITLGVGVGSGDGRTGPHRRGGTERSTVAGLLAARPEFSQPLASHRWETNGVARSLLASSDPDLVAPTSEGLCPPAASASSTA